MSRSRLPVSIVIALSAAVLMLSACAPTPPDRAPAHDENFQPPMSKPEFVPGGSADENLPYFHETLRQFATASVPVEGVSAVNAVSDAGFEKQYMQVSFDQSKTHLTADSIYVSVLVNTDCLIGQIVVADRSFVSSVEPAVGPEQNLCLIGETRPIDW